MRQLVRACVPYISFAVAYVTRQALTATDVRAIAKAVTDDGTQDPHTRRMASFGPGHEARGLQRYVKQHHGHIQPYEVSMYEKTRGARSTSAQST